MVEIDLDKPNPLKGVEIANDRGFMIVKFEFKIDSFHNGFAHIVVPEGVSKIEVSAK